MNDDSPLVEDLRPLAVSPPPDPFWTWRDVFLFFGLGLPAIVIAQIGAVFVARAAHLPATGALVLVAGQAFGYLALFGVLAGILRVQYDAPFWYSLGWRSSRLSLPLTALSGVGLAFALALLGSLLHVQAVNSPLEKLLASPEGRAALAVFGTTIAPVAEELAFRGFLQPLLVRAAGVIVGVLVTALLFGLLHFTQYGHSWGHVAIITAAGIAFGAIRQVSGSTRAAAVAHIAYNGTLFLGYFAQQGRNYTI